MNTYNYHELSPLIGDVYYMDFNLGNGQHGMRPGVVIQNDIGNRYSPMVIAVPLTSARKNLSQPTHVSISASATGYHKPSIALCENPTCVYKENIGEYITTLSDEYMEEIAVASMCSTPLISFIPTEKLLEVQRMAYGMTRKGMTD